MKKNILYFFILLLFVAACSTKKNGVVNRTYHNFTSYYNTLFNGNEALLSELENRKKTQKDNFYTDYIELLPYENSLAELENQGSLVNLEPTAGMPRNNNQSQQGKGATALEIAEAKALKAIAQHSMIFNGEEKNKEIFNAHLLLIKARLFQNKNHEALEAISTLENQMPKDKRLPLAKIYEGIAFTKLKDFARAKKAFIALKNNSNLTKDQQKLLSIHLSEMLIKTNKKEDAVQELENAYVLNKDKKLRSRIAFLRGQVLAKLGKNQEARESFVTAYKDANNYEFEVKSQIEIAKTYGNSPEDYELGKAYIEDIAKKGTYASRKNELYYALALMANKVGKKEEAATYLRKSIDLKESDPQIRGLAYYELGKSYFANDDFIAAGAYYDSATSKMNYEPMRRELETVNKNIKEISKNYYLIKKNDSILALTKMSETEKTNYFKTYIDKLKQKEAAKEALARKEAREKGFETGDYNTRNLNNTIDSPSNLGDITQSSGKFYFANAATVAKGEADFRRIWGQRDLVDNWRYSSKTASIEDLKNEALGKGSGAEPRRFEPDYYIEKIPTKESELLQLKKERDTASLGLGRMYENYFGKSDLATKTWYDLVDSQPDSETKLQALYQIFHLNYEKNPAKAERAKQIILAEYPTTSYAEYVRNPKSANLLISDPNAIKAYETAYDLYAKDQFEASKAEVFKAVEKFPKDALIPKFLLLNAFNSGKTVGKEVMILQLEQLLFNYAKTPEGIRAKEILGKIKSDLTDEGTSTPTPTVQTTTPKPEIQTAEPAGQEPSIRRNIPQKRSAEEEKLIEDRIKSFKPGKG